MHIPPAVELTDDGKADAYTPGEAPDAAYSLRLTFDEKDIEYAEKMGDIAELPEGDYVLLSETDVEKEAEEAGNKNGGNRQ